MGLCLKDARNHAGMTQKTLAETSGVSLKEIQALEQGEKQVTDTKTIQKLSEALGVEADALFFDRRVQHIKQKTESKKSMLSCTALQRRCKAYFLSISYTVTATKEVPSGETDAKGHPIYEVKPILRDDGIPITYREYVIPPTIGGLCRFLKLSRETWQNLSKEPHYKDVVHWAMGEILAFHEEQLLLRKDVRGILFNLQHVFVGEGQLSAGAENTISTLPLAEKMNLLHSLESEEGEDVQ